MGTNVARSLTIARTATSSAGFSNGERNITASTMLNMAMLTPVPSASISTAIAVKPGCAASNET
jgi:hypothetical protein